VSGTVRSAGAGTVRAGRKAGRGTIRAGAGSTGMSGWATGSSGGRGADPGNGEAESGCTKLGSDGASVVVGRRVGRPGRDGAANSRARGVYCLSCDTCTWSF